MALCHLFGICMNIWLCLRETSQELSFLLFFDDVKTKEFGHLWRPKMHKNVYILHDSVCVAPSIHTLFVRACNVSAVWWRPLSAPNRGGGKKSRKKGKLICMWGASLDKAEDNKERILSHSDESLLHRKVTSEWALSDPNLHLYLLPTCIFIHSSNGGPLSGFLGTLCHIPALILNTM